MVGQEIYKRVFLKELLERMEVYEKRYLLEYGADILEVYANSYNDIKSYIKEQIVNYEK